MVSVQIDSRGVKNCTKLHEKLPRWERGEARAVTRMLTFWHLHLSYSIPTEVDGDCIRGKEGQNRITSKAVLFLAAARFFPFRSAHSLRCDLLSPGMLLHDPLLLWPARAGDPFPDAFLGARKPHICSAMYPRLPHLPFALQALSSSFPII